VPQSEVRLRYEVRMRSSDVRSPKSDEVAEMPDMARYGIGIKMRTRLSKQEIVDRLVYIGPACLHDKL